MYDGATGSSACSRDFSFFGFFPCGGHVLPYLLDWSFQGHRIRLPAYGMMLALAFSTSYFFALRRAARMGPHPRHIENLFLVCVAFSIVGSRLFHVFFEEFDFYIAHPL